MGQRDFFGRQNDFGCEWCFPDRRIFQHLANPLLDASIQDHAPLYNEGHQLPQADRGQPFLVDRVLKRFRSAWRYFSWFEETPNPNVRVEKEFHDLRTSQSSSSFAGDMISPTIRPVPAIDPSHCFFFGFAVGGTTSATGTPNRVTRMGLRVLPFNSFVP
jgi:hypothetical protein